MRYKDVDLHSIQDLIPMYDTEVFSRFPSSLHETIGHTMGYQMCGAEIRFVPLEKIYITIGSRYSYMQPTCLVYYGSHMVSELHSIHRELTIEINPYQVLDVLWKNLPSSLQNHRGFSNEVVRIVLQGEAFYIRSIHGAHRPPDDHEIPCQKLLSYGTSITQGIGCTSPDLGYPWMLAHRLGYDCYNYAMSGNAFCETAVADFLAESGTYDIITLELSVNMLGNGYSCETFRKRLRYLINRLRDRNPSAQIIATGILPYFQDQGLHDPLAQNGSPDAYRTVMQEVVTSYDSSRIHILNPWQLLSTGNLSADLIHPGNQGMIELAEQFYQEIVSYRDDVT